MKLIHKLNILKFSLSILSVRSYICTKPYFCIAGRLKSFENIITSTLQIDLLSIVLLVTPKYDIHFRSQLNS